MDLNQVERIATLPPSAVLSLAILGALATVIVLVYRNSGTQGLTIAVTTLSDTLKDLMAHNSAMNREFEEIVTSTQKLATTVDQIMVLLRDMLSMKDDIEVLKDETQQNKVTNAAILDRLNELNEQFSAIKQEISEIATLVKQEATKNETK